MTTRTIDAAALVDEVAEWLTDDPELPITAESLSADRNVEREEIEAVLLVLAADGRVELESRDGEMAVVAVAPPAESATELPISLETLEQIDSVVTHVEAAASRVRRLMQWAPFVGIAIGAAAGAMLSEHDRPLASVCAGVVGGIVGYLLKDTLGPRTWWDTV